MSPLYLIATPIGNRKDITLRALEMMCGVDILLCEDTRKTKQLMDFYKEQFAGMVISDWLNIDTSHPPRLLSFFEENEDQRIPFVIQALQNGTSVGLVSNAGTPGISDPGFSLVHACIKNGISIISIPGPSALISALASSGFSADKFTFLSFLPKKAGKQTKIWEALQLQDLKQTICFYESPFRIKKTLETMYQFWGDIEVCIARELTKIHETVITQPISIWLNSIKASPLKGEIVVLFRAGLS